MKKAIFFDRDGVVNIDRDYVYKIEDFEYEEGFLDLFSFCKLRGYFLFVVTNQSGISRGYYTEDSFLTLSNFMQDDLLSRFGFNFHKIYYCPHLPSHNCKCRKPKSGMIEEAILEFNINREKSYIIGDRESDIEAGLNASLGTTILYSKTCFLDSTHMLNTDSNKDSNASFIVNSLHEIKNLII